MVNIPVRPPLKKLFPVHRAPRIIASGIAGKIFFNDFVFCL